MSLTYHKYSCDKCRSELNVFTRYHDGYKWCDRMNFSMKDGNMVTECPTCKEERILERSVTCDVGKGEQKCANLASTVQISLLPVGSPGTFKFKCKEHSSGCFIATAAYGHPDAWQLDLLRQYRDERLLPTRVGSWLVRLYCLLSPPVAAHIADKPRVRRLVRAAIGAVVTLLGPGGRLR